MYVENHGIDPEGRIVECITEKCELSGTPIYITSIDSAKHTSRCGYARTGAFLP